MNIADIENTPIPHDAVTTLLPLVDLTLLSDTASEQDIELLCQQAAHPPTKKKLTVAAVCVHVPFVSLCASLLKNTSVNVATVANFPQGNDSLTATLQLIEKALLAGAHEIDLVLPYPLFLSGEIRATENYLVACEKQIHPHAQLKIILETGALKTDNFIAEASKLALHAGADFLKTSTGKIETGATLKAASILLKEIKTAGHAAGFKASGGIKTCEQAYHYYALTQHILEKKLDASLFRLGMSKLLGSEKTNSSE